MTAQQQVQCGVIEQDVCTGKNEQDRNKKSNKKFAKFSRIRAPLEAGCEGLKVHDDARLDFYCIPIYKKT